MNTKIVLFSSAAAALFSLSVVSCSDDENSSESESLQKELSNHGKIGDYSYVDLGLSVKWATYNVGATQPVERGNYFAWGEKHSKSVYYYTTYTLCNGEKVDGDVPKDFIKYCCHKDCGVLDNQLLLAPVDDAATANWGKSWRMPTTEEFEELCQGCTWQWTGNFNGTGVAGNLGTSKYNGSTIFFPSVGYRYKSDILRDREMGYYWTSSLNGDLFYKSAQSFCALFGKETREMNFTSRTNGLPVRAVVDK